MRYCTAAGAPGGSPMQAVQSGVSPAPRPLSPPHKVLCPRPMTSSNRLWHAVVRNTGFSLKRVPRKSSSATDEHRFSRTNAMVQRGVSPKPRIFTDKSHGLRWCVPRHAPEVSPVQTVQSAVSPSPRGVSTDPPPVHVTNPRKSAKSPGRRWSRTGQRTVHRRATDGSLRV